MKRFSAALNRFRVTVSLSRDPSESQIAQAKEDIEESFKSSNIWFDINVDGWNQYLENQHGYADPGILKRASQAVKDVLEGKAAFERDTVLFRNPMVSHHVLSWLYYAASMYSGVLNVLDFGGALGSIYVQHRSFLHHLDLTWSIVEQPAFIDEGLAHFQTPFLRFYHSVEDCTNVTQPNFLLLSGVLQCLQDPYAILDQMLTLDIPFILIDRTMARRGYPEQVAIQHVPAHIYKAAYPVWFLDAQRIEATLKASGYVLMDSFDPHPGSTFGPPGQGFPYMGWFFAKQPYLS